MERRKEPRVAVKERVTVTELAGERRAHVGLLIETSESSFTMKLVTEIPAGAPVQVETIETLILGEVLRCEPVDEGFRIAVAVRHSLQDLHTLEALNRALAGKRTKQEDFSSISIMRE